MKAFYPAFVAPCLLVLTACATTAPATSTPPAITPSNYAVTASVSPEAQAIYNKLLPLVLKKRAAQGTAHTAEEFEKRREETLAQTVPAAEALLKSLNVTAIDKTMGGVAVVVTTPPGYQDDRTALIHVHGGGFVGDSARGSVGLDARIGILTGKRIVSVDYTVAPKGKWEQVTDEVISVYKTLLAEGYAPGAIGMFGDSAGGNIVSTSTLKMRDQGIATPAALVLLSPGTDFTQSGDTSMTLRYADPALGTEDLQAMFTQYAEPADWKNPYVSPIYGDFTKGFPPTLIQVGTKEMLLSDSVRLYQAIKTAGGDAELDVYEGMPHVFHTYMQDTPEQKAAFAEIKRFLSAHVVAPKQKKAQRVRRSSRS